MITCPWCNTSYLNFQSNCSNCGGPLPLPQQPMASSASLRLKKDKFKVGEQIVAEFTVAENLADEGAVILVSSESEANAMLSTRRLDRRSEGVLTFDTPSNLGTYDLRLYHPNFGQQDITAVSFEVVSGQTSDQLHLVWQDKRGGWHNYGNLPNDREAQFLTLTASLGGDGKLQVVGLNEQDGQPYLIYQDYDGNWHGNYGRLPNNRGVSFSMLTAALGADGKLQVIGLGTEDGQPYLIYQDQGGRWHGGYGRLPNDSGVSFSTLTAALGADGKLQVIGLGEQDGQPYLIYQDQGGHWHGGYGRLPNDSGVAFSSLTAALGADGKLQVIGLGEEDGQPYLIYQDQGGHWHGGYGRLPNDSGVSFSSLTAVIGADGKLQVIGLGEQDGQPYLIYQDQGGHWHGGYGRLPNDRGVSFSTLTAALGADGKLQVIGLGAEDSQPYLIYQDYDGNWHGNYGRLPHQPDIALSSVIAVMGADKHFQVIGLM